MNYALPFGPLIPCSKELPESTHSCAIVLLYPKTMNAFGVFDEVPPEPLPTDFPKGPFENKGHTLAPDYFAELDGAPVALNYTRWIGKKPGAAPDECLLETRIHSLDVGLSIHLPCTEMDRWRSAVRSMIKAVKDGTVSSDRSASCSIPPTGAVIRLNEYDHAVLDSMSQWLDFYR